MEKKKYESLSSIEYDARNVTKDKIISILSLPLEKRTLSQKTMLTFFVSNVSKLPQKFIKEHIDKASYNNIINLSEPSFSYKLILNKNSLVYEVNDIANYFYIILNGSAKIIKLEKYVNEMNAHEFYTLLMNYKKQNELRLLEKTIKENYHIFPIELKDLNILEKIYLKVLIIRHEEKYSDEPIENIVKKVGLQLSDFGIITYREELEKRNNEINEENNLLILEKKMHLIKGMIQYNYEKEKEKNRENRKKLKKLLKNITTDLTIQYSFLANEGKSSILYFKFLEYNNISQNDYFGDIKNEKYIHRVISTSDELELLLMRNDIYVEFMKNQKYKIKTDQINFLTQNFFFSSINKFLFEKLYYDLFEYENYKMNDIILKENTKVEYLYFIQKGKIDLISNKSVIENHLIINIIYDILLKQRKKYKNNTVNDKYLKLYSSSYIQNFQEIDKEIYINKKNNLMIYQENQCIGHECFFYGFNYLYTAVAKSGIVEVYKIGVDKLMKIIKDKNNIVYNEFIRKSWESLLLFYKLIINLNTNLLRYYHKNKTKENNKNKEDKENDNKDIFIINDKNKMNNSTTFNSEIIKSNLINMEKKIETNNFLIEDNSPKYKFLPILSKSQNIRSFSYNSDENIDKNNNVNEQTIKLEKLPINNIKNSSLYISNSNRTSNSSNNISNINLKYKFKNLNFNSIIISNNANEKKIKPIFENSLLRKLRQENTNSINLFNLSRNVFNSKDIDTNRDNKSTTIITFDFPIQQQYKYSLSVKNSEDTKYKSIDYDNCDILSKRNKKYIEFNKYYKFYSSEFYSKKDFIKNIFKYNNKQTILTNKKLLKYGILDTIRPKIKNKNKNLNFEILSNLDKNIKKNKILFRTNSDKYMIGRNLKILTRLNDPINDEEK